jgi:hypothetical protein
MQRKFATGLVLLSVAGLLGVAGRVAPCDPAGADFCGFERAEDVAFLPGTGWFVVSHGTPESTLVLIDARSRRRVAIADAGAADRDTAPARGPAGERHAMTGATPAGAADCAGRPQQFRAGGNDVRRLGSGFRVVVLNKPAPAAGATPEPDRVELWSVEVRDDTPHARWLGCVPVPAAYSLNDVALAADGTIYGSHQFDRPATPAAAAATRQRWLDGEPTGYAVQWRRDAGWSRVAGTELSFTNGIAVSRDDRLLAVAGTYSKALLLVDRRRGGVQRVALPHTPDNITALSDGSFLSVGHTGVPVTGVDPCRPAEAVPCGFPFSVAHVIPVHGGRAPRIEVSFEHDGSRIPGASVAAPHAGRLYLGSFFGDRVTVVDAPADLPRR